MKTITEKVKESLINAGSSFNQDLKRSYHNAINNETNDHSRWVLNTILENALVAEQNKSPLCDDTGIPHLLIEIGKNRYLSGEMLEEIYCGIQEGLSELPGRPMSIDGNDLQRIDQSGGINWSPSAVEPAPIFMKKVNDPETLRLHILLLGGGPAIRGKTERVFHQHSVEVVKNEIISWAKESVKLLGCTPSTLAIGIGRSHYEATALMLEAQVYGSHSHQNEIEQEITRKVNESKVGALGLGGDISVLATFLKVGPQRASGVRIVSMCPCCCVEPRISSVEL